MNHSTERVNRYLHLREIGRRLNSVLVKRLSKDVLNEGGKDLDILREGILVLDSEDAVAVLLDYCIYNVLRQGVNAVEQFLADRPPPADSDEMLVLEGMSRAWYSIFTVEEVEPGAGVRVQDLLRGADHFLVDINMSRCNPRGGMLATRVIPLDDFIMTTGAALPLGGREMLDPLVHSLAAAFFETNVRSAKNLLPEQEREVAKGIIRAARAAGVSSFIRYQDADQEANEQRDRARVSGAGPQLMQARTTRRIGRNEPCPCGSGRKYKKCCMAR
jgi:hypothetical protein